MTPGPINAFMDWSWDDWAVFAAWGPLCAWIGYTLGHKFFRREMRLTEETQKKKASDTRLRQTVARNKRGKHNGRHTGS